MSPKVCSKGASLTRDKFKMGALAGIIAFILQVHVVMAAPGSWQVGLLHGKCSNPTCSMSATSASKLNHIDV